jgi:hypothetical protein
MRSYVICILLQTEWLSQGELLRRSCSTLGNKGNEFRILSENSELKNHEDSNSNSNSNSISMQELQLSTEQLVPTPENSTGLTVYCW